MNLVYLLLGSNLGDKAANLQLACRLIGERIGQLKSKSSVYQTAPWGFVHEEQFLNQCLAVETLLNPQEVLKQILRIEQELGRFRTQQRWEARVIDVDILLFNNDVVEEKNLRIPHPHLAERRFALTPLNEIACQMTHPVFKVSIHELLERCPDQLFVQAITGMY